MNNCCNTCDPILDMGSVPHCGAIELPLVAKVTGIHYLLHSHGNVCQRVPFATKKGSNMVVPGLFNESIEIVFQIEEPDGDIFSQTMEIAINTPCTPVPECITILKNPVCYDRFKFKTCITVINDLSVDVCATTFDCEDQDIDC